MSGNTQSPTIDDYVSRRSTEGGGDDRGRSASRGTRPGGMLRRLRYRLFSGWSILMGLLLILTAICVVFFWSIVVVIRPGEAGVLYSLLAGGTVTDYVYAEGLHLKFPWNRMHIYNMRVQAVTHEFTVLTNKGLPVHLKLAIRYRPDLQLLGLLHQQVGPDYSQKIIVPEVESVMRQHIGRHDPEDIYTNKEGILADIVQRAIEQTGKRYVSVEDVIIRAVELPKDIRAAIEEKLVHQQRFQAYEFRLAAEAKEAERKRIEAQGVRDFQAIVSETLSRDLLTWRGIQATEKLADSDNSKVVVVGAGRNGLPIILGDR